jgi:peptide-methionine (S)-S-oxide reductase
VRTLAGYAGGRTATPTYHDLAGAAEAIQIVFDPQQLPWAELLQLFWDRHDPFAEERYLSSQYRAAVFVTDAEQRQQVEASRQRITQAAKRPRDVKTPIENVAFYRAEPYHQKYYLRRERELFAALALRFPSEQAFIDSTLATRINSYVGGHVAEAQRETELLQFQLPSTLNDRIRALSKTRRR